LIEPSDAVANEIKDICLRLLARREHSQKELLNKLALRGFNKDEILPVLRELAEQGWQDDLRYAENYARFRILKGYGPLRVNYELLQNGITGVDLDKLVHTEAESWPERLAQVYKKKYTHELALERKEWAKRSRFLLYRGFSGEMISALLAHLAIKLK
jgi:regulatory protein